MDTASGSSSDGYEIRVMKGKGQKGIVTSTPRVISTPTRRRLDSDASSVHSIIAASVSDASLASSSRLMSDDETSLIRVNINRIKKFPLKGNDYLLFEPKRKSSLYSRIITHFNDLESLIRSWMVYYDKHRNEAIEMFTQLFLDVGGFQKIIFNIDKDVDYEQLLVRMQKKPTPAHLKFQCVLKSKSVFGKTFCKVFYAFLHRMVLLWYGSNIIHDRVLVEDHVLKLLSAMGKSQWRVTVFTSCAIALKLCTSFIYVREDLHNNLQYSENYTDDVIDRIELEKLKNIDKCIKQFMSIIKKYCFLSDSTFYTLRVTYANECMKWFKINPEHYITEENINILRKLIIDEKKEVRIAALAACEYALQLEKHKPFVIRCKKPVEQLILTITKRLIDIDYHVREGAIKCLHYCYVNYTGSINENTQVLIAKNIFCKNFDLANQAGKFCAEILREDNDNIRTIRNVLIFDRFPELQDLEGRTALLVEALVNHLAELSDLNLLLSLTISEDIALGQSEVMVLLEISFHVTNICVKGNSYTKRMPMLKNVDLVKGNRLVAETWIPLANDLIRNFQEDDEAILWIVKSLNLIDFEHMPIIGYKSQIFRIFESLCDILISSPNNDVLKQIAMLFAKFRKGNIPFKAEFIASFDLLLDQLVTDYETYLTELLRISQDDVHNLTRNISLLSILFEFHQTGSAKWSLLCMSWANSPLNANIIGNQMICSKFYLKWQLDNILYQYPNVNITQMNSWRKKSKTFFDNCLDVCNSSTNDALLRFTHMVICDFFIYLGQEKRENPAIAVLELDEPMVDMEDYKEFLVTLRGFVIKRCFLEVRDSLHRRRNILFKFLELTHLQVVTPEELFYVFNYYPMLKEDYDDIFKFILLKTDKLLFLFRMLTHSYEKNQYATATQALANEFVTLLQGKMITGFLQLAVNYVSDNNNNANFFNFMVPFVTKGASIDRKSILIEVNNKLPQTCLEMEPVKQFIAHLSASTKAYIASDRSSIHATSTTDITSVTVPESNSDEDYSIVDIDEEG